MSKSDHQLAHLGAEAAQVLSNPAFSEALRLMRESAYTTFKRMPIKDAEGLVLAAQAARLTDAVESTLRGMLQAGKMAQSRIDLNSARSESKLRRGMRAVTGR
ncbi:hypothetical protein [Variovorax sp. PBL-E5]|uniref:hypothetical protein n=1 Tax=Variovorax sp. PBL-E5 TaxID=434014 RepID=UPI001318F0A3|nr:hypothetical protein [Variovorax sp. PBL-E5]VTU37042.1 hypothetical protein E5CHR_04469 [Variovorax sp. PBL-E5]